MAASGQPEKALGEFLKVAFLFEDVPEVAEALLAAGECLEALNDPSRAADRYREVIDRFPESGAAAQARQKLQLIKGL